MFCRYCGKEVLDQAYMCPSCGRMLKELPSPIVEPIQIEEKPKDDYKVKTRIFSIIGIALGALQILLIGAALVLIGSIGYFTEMCKEGEAVVAAVYGLFSFAGGAYASFLYPVTLTMGIMGFCNGRKTQDTKGKRLSVAAFIISLVAAIFVAVLWVFIFNDSIFGL